MRLLAAPRRCAPTAALGLLVLLGGAAGAPAEPGWFHEITTEVGLEFVHDSGALGTLEMPEIMSPGVAFLDSDGDGDLDLYLMNGSFKFSDPTRTDGPVNRLFRSDPGPKLVEVTASSGLGDPSYSMGIAVGDYDGDGRRDVYVTNVGPDHLYRNLGEGKYRDVTEEARIHVDAWSCSASFLDYDRDGDLDLYVTRYVDFDPTQECSDASGRPEYCGPLESPPIPDVLLRNEGDGTFSDVSVEAGMADQSAAGLGVVCADLDEDGWTDVYVANDAYANHFWINQQDGTFFDDALLLGAAFNLQGMAEAGMGVIAADFDQDLDLDLFMTHLRNESNTLYTFEGPALGFEDHTAEAKLGRASMQTTGFGTVAFDVELDGDLDIVVGNGSVNRGDPWPGSSVPPPWDRYAEPNHLYLNEGSGRFRIALTEAGPLAEPIELTRGVAAGDVDDDGDLDVLLVNGNGPARLYRNDAPRQGHWLSVALEGVGGTGLGARVIVHCGERSFLRTAAPGLSYLSSSDPRVHFGLGGAIVVDEIEVRWADATVERFEGGAVDRFVRLRQGEGKP